MLQILRNKAQSFVIQAMVIVIALVFVFWGVGANLMDNREAALVVNDEEVSFETFQKEYEQTYTELQAQLGENIPQNLLEGLGIKQQVISRLIQNALLRQGAGKMGLTISPMEIKTTVENMIQFQDSGSFNIDKYKELLALNGYSPHKFEEAMRFDMLAQRAALDIQNFITTVTDHEINDIHEIEKTTVAVDYVTLTPSDFQASITPTNEELITWFALVKDNYKTQPRVKLKYLPFTYDDIGKKVTIDKAEVAKHYSLNLADYTSKEQRRARHILFKAGEKTSASVHADQLKKAKSVLELAKAGEVFAELARKFSEGPSKETGGDLGLFPKGRMVKPFDEAVFSMNSGEISNIVRTDFGYHIIKLEEIQPGISTPLSEVHDQIVEKLRILRAQPIAFELANKAYEAIISAGSLQAYMNQTPEATLKETDFFTRNTPPPELKGDNKFINTAFALKAGELSSLIETSSGYAILFAEEITPPKTPELDDVKMELTKDFQLKKAQELAKENATALLTRAKTEGDLKKGTIGTSQQVKQSGYLSKRNQGKSTVLPANIIEQAFQLSAKSPFPEEPGEANGVFFVLQFTERKTPQAKQTGQEIKLYKEALLQYKKQQILSSWLQQQEKEAKIMTNQNI